MYTLKNVIQRYNGRTVLDLNHLQIQQGEILAIVGPSGAGKSTLLRLLAFLEQPAQGQIHYNGRLCNNGWPDLTTRRQVIMVFQRPQLLRRTILENVAYGLRLRGQKNNHQRIMETLEQLGLASLAEAPAHTLSGGEMQRVALARTLVLRPQVWLLDEPTANLDPYNIKLIEQIVIQANQEQNVTIVIVTHNIFQARRVAQRTALLLDSKLIEIEQTKKFFEQPQNPQTAAFVQGEIIY